MPLAPKATNKPPLIVMGIDPGTYVLGYGIIKTENSQRTIEAMGVIDLRKCTDVYLKLGRIYEHVQRLIDTFHPDELAIESPFFGKNYQTAISLGRAQGVAIAAAISRDLVVHEYPPTKVKQSITGTGSASKQQVATMLQKLFKIQPDAMIPFMDATDALAIAYCHISQRNTIVSSREYSTWSAFAKQNSQRIVSRPTKKKK